MIDFTNLPTRKKAYGGANGNKLSVVYNGELYMLKLPMHDLRDKQMSFAEIGTILNKPKSTISTFLLRNPINNIRINCLNW